MQRFRAIAAILMLVVMVPQAPACAAVSSGATSQSQRQHECCKQKMDSCCGGYSQVCCGTQAPADTSLLLPQNASPVVLPTGAVVVVPIDRSDNLKASSAARLVRAEHSPPGLMIVATTILRI
jgi:hypothetical protein